MAQWRSRWQRQRPDVRAWRAEIASQQRHCAAGFASQLRARRHALAALTAQLELLNPQRTLERGYAIVSDSAGHVLRSTSQIKPQDKLTVRLAEGTAEVGVASVQEQLG